MITDIRDYSKKEIINYLTYKAGSNNDYHFIGEKIEVELQDNLELQQVPREYAELLCFLRDNKTHSYLNIGIGNGGSFLLETFIQKDLKKSVAVDNMSYGRMSNLANAEKRINWLKKNMSAQIKFYNLDSSLYFNYNTNFYKDTFDVIFIDGDHSYQGVKADFEDSIKILNPNGKIVFHDINSLLCEGVVKFWSEIKNKNCQEFIDGNKCGIGIYEIKS